LSHYDTISKQVLLADRNLRGALKFFQELEKLETSFAKQLIRSIQKQAKKVTDEKMTAPGAEEKLENLPEDKRRLQNFRTKPKLFANDSMPRGWKMITGFFSFGRKYAVLRNELARVLVADIIGPVAELSSDVSTQVNDVQKRLSQISVQVEAAKARSLNLKKKALEAVKARDEYISAAFSAEKPKATASSVFKSVRRAISGTGSREATQKTIIQLKPQYLESLKVVNALNRRLQNEGLSAIGPFWEAIVRRRTEGMKSTFVNISKQMNDLFAAELELIKEYTLPIRRLNTVADLLEFTSSIRSRYGEPLPLDILRDEVVNWEVVLGGDGKIDYRTVYGAPFQIFDQENEVPWFIHLLLEKVVSPNVQGLPEHPFSDLDGSDEKVHELEKLVFEANKTPALRIRVSAWSDVASAGKFLKLVLKRNLEAPFGPRTLTIVAVGKKEGVESRQVRALWDILQVENPPTSRALLMEFVQQMIKRLTKEDKEGFEAAARAFVHFAGPIFRRPDDAPYSVVDASYEAEIFLEGARSVLGVEQEVVEGDVSASFFIGAEDASVSLHLGQVTNRFRELSRMDDSRIQQEVSKIPGLDAIEDEDQT